MNTSPTKSFMFPPFLKRGLGWILLLFLLTFGLLFPFTTKAQTAGGLTAIPPRLGSDDSEAIVVKPGQVITKTIKVRNESNQEKFITTDIKDIIVTDSKGTPTVLEDNQDITNRWSAASWIQVSPSQYRIKAGETKALQVIIIAPEDALPGGHYAGIYHNFKSNGVGSDQTSSAINTQVATLVYITVPGDIKEDAQVTRFSVPKFSEYGPIDVKTTIANLSDIHITPQGMIAITNWFGGKTASLAVDSTNIFPGTSRDFTNTLNKKWLFGRYKAQLVTSYGTSGQALVATAFFWVIPVRLIIVLIAITAIVILLITISNKKQPPSSSETRETDPQIETLKKKYSDKK